MSMTKGCLRDLINEIYQDKAKWVYKNNKNKFEGLDIFNKRDCRKFIETYFGCTGKDSAPNTLYCMLDSNDRIDDNRCQHIVMTFFYGLVLYDKCRTIKQSIDKFLNADKYRVALEKHQDAPFAYVWFLICLFHDLAYPFEYKRGDKREFKSYQGLSENKKWDETPDGVPSEYTTKLLEHYFDYRNSGDDAMNDHGICAGHHLYADLCKIRMKKARAAQKGWWKEELEDIFNLAAWVVACHNIWTIKEDNKMDTEKYRNAHLDPLIIRKDKEGKLCYKIHLHEHPFLFMFCLVDSIEPVKVIKDVTLLDKIQMEILDNGLKIDVQLTCGCHDRILANIGDLNNWLTDVSVAGDTGRICFTKRITNNKENIWNT